MKKIFCVILIIVFIFAFSSVANAQITKDQYYARSTLSDDELDYYDDKYDYLLGNGKNTKYSDYGISYERADQIVQYVYNDSPELYTAYGFYSDEYEHLEKQLKEKSTEILSYIYDGMTDYDKFEVVYAYLATNIEYDRDAQKKRENPYENREAADAQTIIGGLLNGKAVCTGMAHSLQYILYQLDIPCYCVTGSGHEWNIVQLEDEWYITDLTMYEEIKAGQLYSRILTDEKYYEWYNLKPDEYNPPMPKEFGEYPYGPIRYDRPKPTPTPTPQPTYEPVHANTPEPQEDAAETFAKPENSTDYTLWYVLGGAAVAAVLIVLAVRRKKKA